MIIHKDRVDAYIATVDLKDPNDMQGVVGIRSTVKAINEFYKNRGDSRRFYVKLQGRGSRRGVRRYWISLPLIYASSADVYLYERH